MPDPGTQRPSAAGFSEAQDRKRKLLGSTITFLWPVHVTFPPGLPLNPNTNQPFDALAASGIASAQASASAVGSVFFKAVNRGGAAGADISAPIGIEERTRVFVSLASADGQTVQGLGPAAPETGPARDFIFHGARFKILAIKDDEIVMGYRRTLVYGAGEGADPTGGFDP